MALAELVRRKDHNSCVIIGVEPRLRYPFNHLKVLSKEFERIVVNLPFEITHDISTDATHLNLNFLGLSKRLVIFPTF